MPQTAQSWTPITWPPDVPKPVGAYSPAVRAGDFIYVSGQVPRDPRTGALAGDDLESQVRKTLDNVKQVLALAGASLDDVVSTICYLANVDDWGAFNEIYKQVFKPPYPSRTALGANLRGILVEVSAVAYVPRS